MTDRQFCQRGFGQPQTKTSRQLLFQRKYWSQNIYETTAWKVGLSGETSKFESNHEQREPARSGYMIPQVDLFSFIFWKIWRHQKVLWKLTDLQHMSSSNEYLGKEEVVNCDVKNDLTPVCVVFFCFFLGGGGQSKGVKGAISSKETFSSFASRERDRKRQLCATILETRLN